MATHTTRRDAKVMVRVSAAEREVLTAAAQQSHEPVSRFVRQAAVAVAAAMITPPAPEQRNAQRDR